MIEAAPDGLVLVDDAGRIEIVNRRFELLFGYDAGELVGRSIDDLVPVRHRAEHPRHRRGFVALPSIRSMGAGRELHGRRKDGTEFPAEVSLSPLVVDSHTFVVAVVSDITVRRALESRLALGDRLASLGTLATGMAHEINNPLVAVVGNLDMVADELRAMTAGSPSARLRSLLEMVEEARAGAARVERIVRGLKLFVHADQDRRTLLEIPAVIEVAIQLALHEILPRAKLIREFRPVPPVLADEGRLAQVFINLLMNATQALPLAEPDRSFIRITTWTEGPRAVVTVEDNGRGIPRETQDHVFEPFFTTKEAGEGAGLGLSICHGIVTALGGSISFDSGEGGTTFRVELPAAEPAASPVTD